MGPKRPKSRLLRPGDWPLTIRVPVMVVMLMVAVSAVISERVLSRLVETQNRHLSELASAYLDGVSSAVQPQVIREDVWEVYDVLDRAASQYKGLDVVWTTVTDADGIILASSIPRTHVTQSRFPAELQQGLREGGQPLVNEARGISRFKRALVNQDRVIGAIYGEVRIGALIHERWEVLMTLLATNAVVTILLAAVGYLMIGRMMRPIGLLSDHMRVELGGDVMLIPDHQLGRAESEFGRLFRSYNALVMTVRDRERLLQTLAEEERLAALGRLASVMAHEINNPLGGMLNSIRTLKRHGERDDVRASSAELIERGLLGIRNVVRSILATYRAEPDEKFLRPEHIDDLAVLVRPEIRRKGLNLKWQNGIEAAIFVAAHPVRDATLNLLLNACEASPAGATIELEAEFREFALLVRVRDEGPGLPEPLRSFLLESAANHAPIDDMGGLGLWIVKRLVSEAGGSISIEKGSHQGTIIELRFPEIRPEDSHLTAAELTHAA